MCVLQRVAVWCSVVHMYVRVYVSTSEFKTTVKICTRTLDARMYYVCVPVCMNAGIYICSEEGNYLFVCVFKCVSVNMYQ